MMPTNKLAQQFVYKTKGNNAVEYAHALHSMVYTENKTRHPS